MVSISVVCDASQNDATYRTILVDVNNIHCDATNGMSAFRKESPCVLRPLNFAKSTSGYIFNFSANDPNRISTDESTNSNWIHILRSDLCDASSDILLTEIATKQIQ